MELVVLGALLAIAGGVIGQLVDSRLRRGNKRNEYIAEREVNACVWIYPKFKLIVFYLNREVPDFQGAQKVVGDNNALFLDNRLLLPKGVPEAWVYCRNAVVNRNKKDAIRWAHKAFPIICRRFDLEEFP